MGTESTRGESIDFEPPILASTLEGSIYGDVGHKSADIELITHREDEYVKDEEGWEVRRTRTTITGVKPFWEDCFEDDRMQNGIQAFLDFLKKKDALPRKCGGYIQKVTENGELSRFYIRDGIVHEVAATISWPGWEDQ